MKKLAAIVISLLLLGIESVTLASDSRIELVDRLIENYLGHQQKVLRPLPTIDGYNYFLPNYGMIHNALRDKRAYNPIWNIYVTVDIVTEFDFSSCEDPRGKKIAYVIYKTEGSHPDEIMPDNMLSQIFFCPSFFLENSEIKQTQSILHEFYHAVIGTGGGDECGAMFFEMSLAFLAFGEYKPSPGYWIMNNCSDRGWLKRLETVVVD